MKTYGGIYTDINESDYSYEFKDLKFFFSSQFYMKKFDNNVRKYIDIQKQILYNKYRIPLEILANIELYLAIAYYRTTEKRGFKVLDKNGRNI